MATVKERLDKHDRQIAAITALMKQGMRMLNENQRLTLEMRKELKALVVAQQRTEATLDAFIASMRRGSNGHGKPS